MPTSTVSPAAALPIAPLMVAHGCTGLAQELASDPPGATYQLAGAARATAAAEANATREATATPANPLYRSRLGASSHPLAYCRLYDFHLGESSPFVRQRVASTGPARWWVQTTKG